jgi:hypothetical protein
MKEIIEAVKRGNPTITEEDPTIEDYEDQIDITASAGRRRSPGC